MCVTSFSHPLLPRSGQSVPTNIAQNPALMATKTSILAFYLTLSKTQKLFRWATLATLTVVNVGGLALTLLNIVQCRPITAAFRTVVPESAHCTDILTLYLSSAPLNIITDLAILALPMPILTSMRLPRKQKIILVVTFSFGVFVAVVDVVRIAYLQSAATNRLRSVQEHQDTSGSAARNSEANDFSWYASFTFMWSAIEVGVGIMCACVPALKPLVSRFLPHFLRDHPDDNTKGVSSDPAASLDMGTHRLPSPKGSPTRPAPAATASASPDTAMDMMDFLTTPDMQQCERSPTALTNTTRNTSMASPTFFDFVNMKRRKSLVYMTNKESYFPLAMVTILFFVWGFAYGLLDVLNARFQQAANMSSGQSIGIHSAYFAAYFVGPVTFGRFTLKNWGFKACYVIGLVIYACGTLVFWPAAVLSSFPAFLVSNFIVGLGLSTLEIAANPFIALCGPPQYAEVRLNLSQGIQAIGTVLSPLLAQKVLFKVDASSLIDVQWTYLGISLFTFLLAIAYFYMPLPEATDLELADASERLDYANNETISFGTGRRAVPVIFITLGLGVLSQFCYVGGQEAVATSYSDYMQEVYPGHSIVNQSAISHTAFASARFLAAFLNMYLVKPRHLLIFMYGGVIIFSALAMNWSGARPVALSTMVFFFEGPIFSLIFAMCLRGMGKHTKDASALLTAAISGGAVFPPLAHATRHSGGGAQYGMCVPLAAFAIGSTLAIYFQLTPKAKDIVDPIANPLVLGQRSQQGSRAPSIRLQMAATQEKGKRWYEGVRTKFNEKIPVREHRERGSVSSSQKTVGDKSLNGDNTS